MRSDAAKLRNNCELRPSCAKAVELTVLQRLSTWACHCTYMSALFPIYLKSFRLPLLTDRVHLRSFRNCCILLLVRVSLMINSGDAFSPTCCMPDSYAHQLIVLEWSISLCVLNPRCQTIFAQFNSTLCIQTADLCAVSFRQAVIDRSCCCPRRSPIRLLSGRETT
jgi:hypothetical protein